MKHYTFFHRFLSCSAFFCAGCTQLTTDNRTSTEAVIRPIVEQVGYIDAVTHWSKVDSLDLYETSEGGVAEFYYERDTLRKIVVSNYGEMFQQITSFYTRSGRLLFILDSLYAYDRPIYDDFYATEESDDGGFFDVGEAEVTESKLYFDDDRLVHYSKDPAGTDGLQLTQEAYLHDIQRRFRALMQVFN